MLTKRTSDLATTRKPRVLVTRAAEQASSLTEALSALGIEPVVVSTISIVPPPSFADLDQAIAELEHVDYLILTSVNAVHAFFDRLASQGYGLDSLRGIKLVAVGPKSAEALSQRGIDADLVPKDYRAEGVVALLRESVSGKRLLYPRAALARDLIPTELEKVGAEIIAPVAYTSAAPADAGEKLHRALNNGLEMLTFTASSTVQNFVELLNATDLDRAKQIPVASIGPLTTDTAKELGFNIVVEAQSSTLGDLVGAIDQYFFGTNDSKRSPE